MADIMAEQLPALSEREQGVLMDRIIAKLKDMDLYSGIVCNQMLCTDITFCMNRAVAREQSIV